MYFGKYSGKLRDLMALATFVVATSALSQAQTQANPFLDDSTVQVINLTVDPNDWATLQRDYLLNTYYRATFVWNGQAESRFELRQIRQDSILPWTALRHR